MGVWLRKHKAIADLILPLVCLTVCLVWAAYLPVDSAPDEYMRLPIPFYILEHGSLPLGSDPAIRNEIWGTSYGFTPYGTSLFGLPFALVATALGASKAMLIFSPRIPSALFVSGSVLLCEKIGHKIFGSVAAAYTLAIFVGFLPQVVFLGAYLNQDSMTIFATCLVLYAWLYGIENRWNIRGSVLLGVALGICALSYYFAYGYILLSIAVYLVSAVRFYKTGQLKIKQIVLRALVVFIVAMCVGGWFFVRNYVLYDGDLFGRATSSELSERYAQLEHKPSMIMTQKMAGISIFEMIPGYWLTTTVKSFIATLGYMTAEINILFYVAYLGIFCLGIIFSLFYFKRGKSFEGKALVVISLLLSGMIVVCLDIYYSWAVDYQPQGRYLMGALLPLMVLVAAGFDALASSFYRAKRIKSASLVKAIPAFYLLMFVVIFIHYVVPSFMGGGTLI